MCVCVSLISLFQSSPTVRGKEGGCEGGEGGEAPNLPS